VCTNSFFPNGDAHSSPCDSVLSREIRGLSQTGRSDEKRLRFFEPIAFWNDTPLPRGALILTIEDPNVTYQPHAHRPHIIVALRASMRSTQIGRLSLLLCLSDFRIDYVNSCVFLPLCGFGDLRSLRAFFSFPSTHVAAKLNL